jgi:hypothetical protein
MVGTKSLNPSLVGKKATIPPLGQPVVVSMGGKLIMSHCVAILLSSPSCLRGTLASTMITAPVASCVLTQAILEACTPEWGSIESILTNVIGGVLWICIWSRLVVMLAEPTGKDGSWQGSAGKATGVLLAMYDWIQWPICAKRSLAMSVAMSSMSVLHIKDGESKLRNVLCGVKIEPMM